METPNYQLSQQIKTSFQEHGPPPLCSTTLQFSSDSFQLKRREECRENGTSELELYWNCGHEQGLTMKRRHRANGMPDLEELPSAGEDNHDPDDTEAVVETKVDAQYTGDAKLAVDDQTDGNETEDDQGDKTAEERAAIRAAQEKEEMKREVAEYANEVRLRNLKKKRHDIVPELIRMHMGWTETPVILTDIPAFGSNPSKWEAYWKAHRKPVEKKKVKKPRVINAAGWDRKTWENKLNEGIINIPHLGLRRVPSTIYNFYPPLKVLYLHDNKIKALPKTFFEDLPSMAWLDLRQNQLRKLPALTQPHLCLRVALFQENKLTWLPYSLGLAYNLKCLNLKKNKIRDPPSAIRKGGCAAIISYLRQQFINSTQDLQESSSSESDHGSESDASDTVRANLKKPHAFAGHTRLLSAVATHFPFEPTTRKSSSGPSTSDIESEASPRNDPSVVQSSSKTGAMDPRESQFNLPVTLSPSKSDSIKLSKSKSDSINLRQSRSGSISRASIGSSKTSSTDTSEPRVRLPPGDGLPPREAFPRGDNLARRDREELSPRGLPIIYELPPRPPRSKPRQKITTETALDSPVPTEVKEPLPPPPKPVASTSLAKSATTSGMRNPITQHLADFLSSRPEPRRGEWMRRLRPPMKPASVTPKNSASQINLMDDVVQSIRKAKANEVKAKYSFELWKNVPYSGRRREDVVDKSVQDMRTGVLKRLNDQTETILQRMKNKEALMKWRESSRLMQMHNDKAETYSGLQTPFGTADDMKAYLEKRGLSVDNFQEEFDECWSKLNDFASSPTSITDTNKALKRLRDVEDIQRRLCQLRISTKNPIPY